MAIDRRQPQRRKKKDARGPFDQELFAGPGGEGPEAGDIFASLSPFMCAPDPDTDALEPDTASPAVSLGTVLKHLSTAQKILLVCVALVAGLFASTLFTKLQPAKNAQPGPARPVAPVRPPQPAPVEPVLPQTPTREYADFSTTQPSLPRPEPLSLQVAEKFYLAGDYETALLTYMKLHRRLPAAEENQPLREFLLFRMALCSKNSGDIKQADSMFRTVALSRLPALRALARYHQSVTLLARERYLEAATRAYQTVALIEVVDYDIRWASAVQQECYFLVAEALSRHLLSLRDVDTDVPPCLWSGHPDIDPFLNLDEPQLKVFLNSGQQKLDEALLSPQIRNVTNPGSTARWSVTCNGASVDELLARFASNARLNLRWPSNGHDAPDEEAVRRRPVYLYLASSTPQQVVTVAAGSVGLLARLDARGNVSVLDPSTYTSLSDHTKLLVTESISLWQTLFLTADDDERAPHGHFALGLLHTLRERLDEAIAEYKLVANRSSQHALAPYGLLYSGRLKVKLRDYVGAHEDFKQLVELYPDSELSDRACLDLADASMKAGLYNEARNLYRKVFQLGLSVESQTESALGAGQAFYETGDYQAAAEWLNRYVRLARDQNRREFHSACLLLGKACLALNNPQQAHAALNLALAGELSRKQHVETVATLVKTYMQQQLFVEALNILEGTQAWQLSQQETVELLLLRTQALRSIGLTDRAIALLAEKGAFLPSPDLKAAVALELARCYTSKGELESARETLSKTYTLVKPGPLARRLGGELARICLRLNRPGQAIAVCEQLLQDAEPGPDRELLLKLQTDAYRRQGQYGRAVASFLERHGDRVPPPSATPASSPGNAR